MISKSFLKKIGLVLRGIGASYRSLPHFIIAGVQKGGTTSLYAYLDQHKGMKLSRPKEVHFFDVNYHKGIKYYRRYFPFRVRRLTTGEASPYYIFHPWAMKRIKQHLPEVKIIVVLRNPILRAYSHYHMQRRVHLEPLESFDEAIKAEEERLAGEKEKMLVDENYEGLNYKRFSYAERGKYYEQVRDLMEQFDRDRLLFIKSESLSENPEKELLKVYDFLGLERDLPKSMKKRHVGSYPEIDQSTMNYLQSVFKEDQEKLSKLLGNDFKWF